MFRGRLAVTLFVYDLSASVDYFRWALAFSFDGYWHAEAGRLTDNWEEAGMPAYAECGGLMYLAHSLSWRGKRCEMPGVIPGDVVMHDRPRGRGYVVLRETAQGLWPASSPGQPPAEIRAHEFHYSSLENLASDTVFAYDVLRGTGVDGKHDGIVHKNLFACYAHLRDLENNHWASRFVTFVRRQRVSRKQKVAH